MSRRPRRRYQPAPLHATISERIGRELEAAAPTYRTAVLPAAPRPAKEVLALLLASTGMALAGRKDARVELLPGTPVTLLISSGGRLRAAMVLPVTEAEARKLVGQPTAQDRDRRFDTLWEEDRMASLMLQDAELDHRRGEWESAYAC